MKLTWDKSLEEQGFYKNKLTNIKYKYKNDGYYYYYFEKCEECNEPFMSRQKSAKYCCFECSTKQCSGETRKKMSESRKGEKHPLYGKHHTKESKQKMSKSHKGQKGLYGKDNGMYGKHHTDETKRKLSESLKGRKFSEETIKRMCIAQKINKGDNWKGNYHKIGIPIFDTYAHQIEWAEEVRRNEQDPNILEVKCFKCGEWYVPSYNNVKHRIQHLNGNENYKGGSYFYCSDQCKNSCSIFNKSPDQISREDAVRAGRLTWLELEREVQPELRQLVLERDEYMCIKCGETENIQCHHIYPVNIEPLLSADIDNCMTLCFDCHKKVHQKDGCKLHQLHMEEC